MNPYRVALAGLVRFVEPPAPRVLTDFVAGLGAVAAWTALIERRAPDEVQQVTAARFADADAAELAAAAAADLAAAARVGAQLIGPQDDTWPGESFRALEWTRPYDKCPHSAVPLALYRRGPRWPVTPHGVISMVGSRAATPYGIRLTTEIAADAANAGFTVASGAAFGIDAAAHRGALLATPDRWGDPVAPTVAVLACGIDRPYPTAHRSLLDRVADDGAVISEYAPGTPPARHRFLVRNRIIAALGEATVVIEAGRRSGSLNTATTAANLGREVYALPGPVTSAMSVGCHDLIRDARATLVTSWEQIAQQIGPLRADPVIHRPGDRPTDGLDLVASRVFDALPSRGPIEVDAICREAGMAVADVLGGLSVLELAGMASRSGGQWRRAALDDVGPGRAPSRT